jgi:four helix bundle protein
MIQSYRDLIVWQKSIDLVVESYRLTRRLPTSERFGLISQIQRAAVSIPANIAEGHGRHHRDDYRQFLSIARGSLKELETHSVIIEKLGYLSAADLRRARSLCDEVSRMLSSLHRRLRQG